MPRSRRGAAGDRAAERARLRLACMIAFAGRPALAPVVSPRFGPRFGLRPVVVGGRFVTASARVPSSGAPTPPLPDDPMAEGHAEVWNLVERARGGDGEAFGQLYDRYVELVYRFIYFRINDRALAEDFTSETFLRALRRIGTISYQGRDVGAWFVTIARNIVLDHLKSARHRMEISTDEVVEGSRTEASPETAVLAALAGAELIAAVKLLGEEQRECVVLRFVHGLSVAETAEIMGKNEGAIKALQHRAVRKLAELVGKDPR